MCSLLAYEKRAFESTKGSRFTDSGYIDEVPAYRAFRYLPLGPGHPKSEWLRFESWLHRRKQLRQSLSFDTREIWVESETYSMSSSDENVEDDEHSHIKFSPRSDSSSSNSSRSDSGSSLERRRGHSFYRSRRSRRFNKTSRRRRGDVNLAQLYQTSSLDRDSITDELEEERASMKRKYKESEHCNKKSTQQHYDRNKQKVKSKQKEYSSDSASCSESESICYTSSSVDSEHVSESQLLHSPLSPTESSDTLSHGIVSTEHKTTIEESTRSNDCVVNDESDYTRHSDSSFDQTGSVLKYSERLGVVEASHTRFKVPKPPITYMNTTVSRVTAESDSDDQDVGPAPLEASQKLSKQSVK